MIPCQHEDITVLVGSQDFYYLILNSLIQSILKVVDICSFKLNVLLQLSSGGVRAGPVETYVTH